jgi:hypothetical protein
MLPLCPGVLLYWTCPRVLVSLCPGKMGSLSQPSLQSFFCANPHTLFRVCPHTCDLCVHLYVPAYLPCSPPPAELMNGLRTPELDRFLPPRVSGAAVLLGLVGLGWVGLGWVGLGWVASRFQGPEGCTGHTSGS